MGHKLARLSVYLNRTRLDQETFKKPCRDPCFLGCGAERVQAAHLNHVALDFFASSDGSNFKDAIPQHLPKRGKGRSRRVIRVRGKRIECVTERSSRERARDQALTHRWCGAEEMAGANRVPALPEARLSI